MQAHSTLAVKHASFRLLIASNVSWAQQDCAVNYGLEGLEKALSAVCVLIKARQEDSEEHLLSSSWPDSAASVAPV